MTIHSTDSGSAQMLVQHLQEKIRRTEISSRNDDGTIISSGSADMDNILPAGGYHRGTIIEWLTQKGSGAEFLSLLAAKNTAQDGGAIVIIDAHNQFYPPAAHALGIQLGNLIVLREHQTNQNLEHRINRKTNGSENSNSSPSTTNSTDFLWAIDQALRCSAIAAVWGELPDFETPQIATRWLRRFQLSAESSGCCGMFLRPIRNLALPSWAEVQWKIRPMSNSPPPRPPAPERPVECCTQWPPTSSNTATGNTRYIRASLIRCRGGVTGQTVDLEINTVTGNVHQAQREHATGKHQTSYSVPLAAQLAHPKARRRAIRA